MQLVRNGEKRGSHRFFLHKYFQKSLLLRSAGKRKMEKTSPHNNANIWEAILFCLLTGYNPLLISLFSFQLFRVALWAQSWALGWLSNCYHFLPCWTRILFSKKEWLFALKPHGPSAFHINSILWSIHVHGLQCVGIQPSASHNLFLPYEKHTMCLHGVVCHGARVGLPVRTCDYQLPWFFSS